MPQRALKRIVAPLEAFFHSESAGGVGLVLAALVALAWANSPWAETYDALWATRVRIGSAGLALEKQLVVWVNDLLMALFFLLVGVEIKRELLTGELNDRRKAALPLVAAVGGMLAPLLVYVGVAHEGAAARGWAIPMATDIAFALGVARLLGRRVPAALVVLLTALAVVDDLGAILVIALFYAADLSLEAHVAAGALTLVLLGLNRAGVQRPGWYMLVGVPLWVAVLKSGVHATLAGVVVGLCVPARVRFSREEVVAQARALLEAAERGADDAATQDALTALEQRIEESQSPGRRLERMLHPLVAFVILPLFALANAGISLGGVGRADLLSPAALGASLGLLLGKPAGVLGASWVAVRCGLAALPRGVGWLHLAGVGALAGIGFTMSLFVAGLAFGEDAVSHRQAKLGVLAASVAAAVLGSLLLRAAPQADATEAA